MHFWAPAIVYWRCLPPAISDKSQLALRLVRSILPFAAVVYWRCSWPMVVQRWLKVVWRADVLQAIVYRHQRSTAHCIHVNDVPVHTPFAYSHWTFRKVPESNLANLSANILRCLSNVRKNGLCVFKPRRQGNLDTQTPE